MQRILIFTISILCYLGGTGGLFYFLAWLGGIAPFTDLNHTPTMPTSLAVIKNLGLISLFAFQHTVMARKSFKEKWVKFLPKSLERSIYVLISGLLCILIAFEWEPVAGSIWMVEQSVAYWIFMSIYLLGVVGLLASSFLINHFELFGLQQGYLHLVRRNARKPTFTEFAFYRFTRHPLYFSFIFIFWSSPEMTYTRFMLALGFTAYIYIGIYFEEKDLVHEYGSLYVQYQNRTPKLIPGTKRRDGAKTPIPEPIQ